MGGGPVYRTGGLGGLGNSEVGDPGVVVEVVLVEDQDKHHLMVEDGAGVLYR